MSASGGTIHVALNGCSVTIKVEGKANCMISAHLKNAVQGLKEKGYHHFILDVVGCQLMDSTFLGVLAGIGLAPVEKGGTPSRIEILNPTPRVAELIENLGVGEVLLITSGSPIYCCSAEEIVLTDIPPDKEELCRTSLEAHQALMKLNAQNVEKFKEVTRFLAEDLKRLESQKPGSGTPPAGDPPATPPTCP